MDAFPSEWVASMQSMEWFKRKRSICCFSRGIISKCYGFEVIEWKIQLLLSFICIENLLVIILFYLLFLWLDKRIEMRNLNNISINSYTLANSINTNINKTYQRGIIQLFNVWPGQLVRIIINKNLSPTQ